MHERSLSRLLAESRILGIGTPSPDTVADAMSTFGIGQNAIDTLKRFRLPPAMYAMELEWREHPVAMIERLMLTNAKLGVWLFVTFCLSTLGIAPVLRLYGGGVLSAVTYPLISFACGLGAFF